MNFDDAVRSHSEWRSKLSAYLKKPDKSLQALEVGADNRCALGKWIYGEGAKFAADPDFIELKKAHAAFHQAAAGLLKRADAGEKVDQEVGLGSSSPYAKISTQVVTLIMKVKAKAAKA